MNRSVGIKLLVSVVLLAALAMRVRWADMGGVIESSGSVFQLLALTALVAQIALLAVRWLFFTNLDRRRIDFRTAWHITIASLFANLLFITSLGGVVVRVAMTAQYGFPWLKSICAGVADRIMTLLAIAALAVLFLPLTIQYINPAHVQSLLWLAVSFVFVGGVLLWFSRQAAFSRVIFYNRRTALAAHYIRELFTRHGELLRIVIVSLAAQIFYFLSVFCLILSMDLSVSLPEVMAVLPFVTLIASLPIGFGGWGVREGAFVYGFGLLGVSVEAAFFLSVQIGVLTILSTVVAGIPALVRGDVQGAYSRIMAQRTGNKFTNG